MLPFQTVKLRTTSILTHEADGETVAIEIDDSDLLVPVSVPLHIVTKAFFKEYYDTAFGNFKVMVSLGDVTKSINGTLKSQHCFSTVCYNESGSLITIEFHTQPR